MQKISIREAVLEDVPDIARLVGRLKRLHEEFDSLLKVREDIETASREYIEKALKEGSGIILVAHIGKKIIGMIKGSLIDRVFFDPRLVGMLEEFYILPEYRRRGVGQTLLDEMLKRLREKGVEIITAEAPAKNMLAANFYDRLSFRIIWNTYAKA